MQAKGFVVADSFPAVRSPCPARCCDGTECGIGRIRAAGFAEHGTDSRPYAEAVVPFFPCRSDSFGFFGRSLVRSERETTGDRRETPIVSFDFPVSDRPKGIVPGDYVGCLQKTGIAMVMPNEKADTSKRGIRFLEIVSDFSGPGRIVIRRNRRFRSRRDRTILPFATESRLSTS